MSIPADTNNHSYCWLVLAMAEAWILAFASAATGADNNRVNGQGPGSSVAVVAGESLPVVGMLPSPLGDLAANYPPSASDSDVVFASGKWQTPVLHVADNQATLPAPLLSQDVEPLVAPTPAYELGGSNWPCHCDTLGPYSPCNVRGFHCIGGCPCGEGARWGWHNAGPIPWQAFAHGEYIGPPRTAHVPEYRLRVDDRLDFVFRLTREPSSYDYRLEVGDEFRIYSLTAPEVEAQVIVQPDGKISLPRINQVVAAGQTIAELRQALNENFRRAGINDPQIGIAPIRIDTRLDELRATVDNRYGRGGQSRLVRVTPEGTIQLPAIGSVYVQGYSLPEVKREIELRYSEIVSGLEVTPILEERAPRFCYVVGEVRVPGRFELVAPTTIIQAISLAGGWNVGARLEHVVVFRRDDNWNLMATKVNLRPALFGNSPCPSGEIWLRDSDIVIVPKSCILTTTDAIDLIFTRGIYSVFPVTNVLTLDTL